MKSEHVLHFSSSLSSQEELIKFSHRKWQRSLGPEEHFVFHLLWLEYLTALPERQTLGA
jgi:hypothetical protein